MIVKLALDKNKERGGIDGKCCSFLYIFRGKLLILYLKVPNSFYRHQNTTNDAFLLLDARVTTFPTFTKRN